MQTFIFEAAHSPDGGNYGKFMVGVFGSEWSYRSGVDPGARLLRQRGWGFGHMLVMDLQTGEGFTTHASGSAHAELCKTRIWVCPLFEPWLTWLYRQLRGNSDILAVLRDLERVVYLPDAPAAFRGYRRDGSCGTGWPA